jgi:hypothetical protein
MIPSYRRQFLEWVRLPTILVLLGLIAAAPARAADPPDLVIAGEVGPARREFVAATRYLHLPVREDAAPRRVRVLAGGRAVREFDSLMEKLCNRESMRSPAPPATCSKSSRTPRSATAGS